MKKFFDCTLLDIILNNLDEEQGEELKPVFNAVKKRYKALNKALAMSGLDPTSFVAAAALMVSSDVKRGWEVDAVKLCRFVKSAVFYVERPRLYSQTSYNVISDTKFVSEGELHTIRTAALKALAARHA